MAETISKQVLQQAISKSRKGSLSSRLVFHHQQFEPQHGMGGREELAGTGLEFTGQRRIQSEEYNNSRPGG
ncbi:hypothetical protein GX48_04349 [Paracoccidioides brasiliensis]|nr:hypothetical protein GX48_04349 [Paracoccidioides brasiliensis]